MFEEKNQYADLAKRILSDRPLAVGYTASFSMSEQQVVQAVIAMVQERLGKARKTVIDENEAMKYIEEHGGMERFARAYINDDYQHYEEKHQVELQAIQQRIQDERQRGEEERQQQALMQMRQKERDDELKMLAVIKELNDRFLGLAGNQMARDTLALNASFLDKVPESKLPEFVKYMQEKMGLEIKGRDHGDVELEEREISKEDTLKRLKDEDLKLVIKTDKFKNPDYKLQLKANEKELNERERKASEKDQTQMETQQVEIDAGLEM